MPGFLSVRPQDWAEPGTTEPPTEPACGSGTAKLWAIYSGTLWAYRTDNTWDMRGSVSGMGGFGSGKVESDSSLSVYGRHFGSVLNVADGCSVGFTGAALSPDSLIQSYPYDVDTHYASASDGETKKLYKYDKTSDTWSLIYTATDTIYAIAVSQSKIWMATRTPPANFHLWSLNLDGSVATDCGDIGASNVYQIFASYLNDVCLMLLPNGTIIKSTGGAVSSVGTIPHAAGSNTFGHLRSYDGSLWIAAHTVAFSGAGYISKSTDGGASWTVKYTGGEVDFTTTAYNGAEYNDTAAEWYCRGFLDGGGHYGGFLVSGDDGETWTTLADGSGDFGPDAYAAVRTART